MGINPTAKHRERYVHPRNKNRARKLLQENFGSKMIRRK
jgi:hypothetical protein